MSIFGINFGSLCIGSLAVGMICAAEMYTALGVKVGLYDWYIILVEVNRHDERKMPMTPRKKKEGAQQTT